MLKMKDAIDSTDKGTSNNMANSTLNDLPNKVSNAIKYCLCHPQWEIRDSAMEFLSKSFAAPNSKLSYFCFLYLKKIILSFFIGLQEDNHFIIFSLVYLNIRQRGRESKVTKIRQIIMGLKDN